MKRLKAPFSAAFSLVEVTLALGICAFCLITLVALLPTGLTATSNASREGIAANIASSILADLQYVALVPERDGDGNIIPPAAGAEQSMVFPAQSPLYGIPCGLTNATSTTPELSTYTTQFVNPMPPANASDPHHPWQVATPGEYFVKVTISPSPSNNSNGPYTFSVEVSWPGGALGDSGKRHGAVTVFGRSRTL